MKKIKILQYFWGKLDAGGAETFIVNMFEHLDQEKFAVDFCAYEKKEYFYTKRILKAGGHIVALQKTESKVLPVRLVKRWYHLFRVLKTGDYDVFHCNCDFAFKWVELLIAKVAGVRIRICHSHNTAIDTNNFKGKVKYLVHLLFRPLLVYFTTDFMACSEDSAKWLFGNRFALSKVLVINNGIKSALYSFNNEIRDEMRHQLHISDQCVLLGNVGRFTKIKNQKFIVDLVEYAREQKNDVKACLIGSGEELDAVQQYICERHLEDDVILPGLTDKVRDYLMAFDCYVLPSIYEGLPVSGIEAQATGLPCVVSKSVDSKLDISGHVTFLDLADGYKVWWQEIVKSVSGKRSDMGDKVRIAGYDISFNAKKISEVYAR